MTDIEAKITESGHEARILWKNGHERRCSVKWIRFHCHCEECKPAFSGMYPLDRTRLDEDIKLKTLEIAGDELRCKIDKDTEPGHVTVIPVATLKETCACTSCLQNEVARRKVKCLHPKAGVPYLDYSACLTDEGLFCCLENIISHGFCVVRKAPFKDSDGYLEFVRKLGPIYSTLYGESWEVKSEIDPINAAYTALGLVSHQDLPIYETSPGVQILYTLRFDDSVHGGESKMVDMLRCAEILRDEHPEHFRTFCTLPATFETIDFKRDNQAWYEHKKAHIEVDYFGEIVAVNWHPKLEGTLRIPERDMEAYYHAYKTFMNIVQDDANQMMFRLSPGDCFIFNNHRMGHAREAFTVNSKGRRHLLGCYTNIDDVKSNYMVLANKLGIDVAPRIIGNRSSF